MANNIVPGPNARVAITSIDFLSMGLNVNNCDIVYEVEGNYKSWKPGRIINPINSITSGKGYVIEAKLSMDLTAYFNDADGVSNKSIIALNNTDGSAITIPWTGAYLAKHGNDFQVVEINYIDGLASPNFVANYSIDPERNNGNIVSIKLYPQTPKTDFIII